MLHQLWVAIAMCVLFGQAAHADEPKRLLLIGQKPDGHPPGTHEYMPGVRLLADTLAGVDGVKCQITQADDPWTDGPELLGRADGAVLFVSEGARWMHGDAKRIEAFEKLAARGGGLVVLHWGMGTKDAANIDRFVRLFGACHGGPDRKFKVIADAEVRVADPQHPVTRGIAGFQIQDEFYYRLKLVAADSSKAPPAAALAVQPLLQVPIDGNLETVAWAWRRPDGGRSFGFSGLHFHSNWQRDECRRLVAQAALWTLALPVPENGLPLLNCTNRPL